jgi:hypothetical protein
MSAQRFHAASIIIRELNVSSSSQKHLNLLIDKYKRKKRKHEFDFKIKMIIYKSIRMMQEEIRKLEIVRRHVL